MGLFRRSVDPAKVAPAGAANGQGRCVPAAAPRRPPPPLCGAPPAREEAALFPVANMPEWPPRGRAGA